MNTIRSAYQGRDITVQQKVTNQKTLDGNIETKDCKVFLVCDQGRKLRNLMSAKKIENLQKVVSVLQSQMTIIDQSFTALDATNLSTITACESKLKAFDAVAVDSVKQYKNKDKELVDATSSPIHCFVSTKNKDGSFSETEGTITGVVMSDAKVVINYADKKNIFVDMKYVCIGDAAIKTNSTTCDLFNTNAAVSGAPRSTTVLDVPVPAVSTTLLPPKQPMSTTLLSPEPPATTLLSPEPPATTLLRLDGGTMSNKKYSNNKNSNNKTTSDYSHCE
jgi:hypothetical protein